MRNADIKKFHKEIEEFNKELGVAVGRGDKKAAANLRKEMKRAHYELKEARKEIGRSRRNARREQEALFDLMVAY